EYELRQLVAVETVEARLLVRLAERREIHGLREVDHLSRAAATAAAAKSAEAAGWRAVFIRLELHVAEARLVLRAFAAREILRRAAAVERDDPQIVSMIEHHRCAVLRVAADAVRRLLSDVIVLDVHEAH